jgi:glycosyltransferase involved in cell wall biosynthesis
MLEGCGVNIVANSLDMKSEYESSSMFIMTSLQEGVPRSLMEAMAMNLPAVVYNVGSISSLNPKFMFAPHTECEMRNALEQLCGSSTFRQEVGAVNRKNVEMFNAFVEDDLKDYFESL